MVAGLITFFFGIDEMFQRGDKIHFAGKDSFFQGYFVSYIEKLPWGVKQTEEIRCVVQQADTGILLIKGKPTEKNLGWP